MFYLCIIYDYAPCVSSCLPDQIDYIASQLFLPVCITYSQNMQSNHRNTTQVDCNVKINKRNEAQMDWMPWVNCSREYFGVCEAMGWWSGVSSVPELEVELTDKIQGDSTEPGPAAQGLTAEYTWPGSFRPYRDNWERLSLQLRSNLTQAIVCGGRSTHSGLDSVNVWLHCNAKICELWTFMHWRWLQMSTPANNGLLSLSGSQWRKQKRACRGAVLVVKC